MSQLTGLTRLDLFNTQITDVGLSEIRNLKNPHDCLAPKTGITDAGLKEFGWTQRTLQHFISGTQRSRTSASKSLVNLENMTTLFLFNTDITDDGLKQLKNLKRLSVLMLNENITDAGPKQLHGLVNLTDLVLPKAKITDEPA